LLAYAKVPFEDQAYTDPVAWGNDKVGLNIDFANLPYLITPEIKLSESTAIHRYIIDKWAPALLGKDIKDQAIIDEILGVFKDAFGDVIGLFFNPQHAEKSPAVLEKAKPKLDLLQNYIGEKETALGYLTYADFVFSEFSHYIEKLWPE
jgi:glutathione S-transferase